MMYFKRIANLPIWLRFLINLSFILFLAWAFFKFLRDWWLVDYFYEEVIYYLTAIYLQLAKVIMELLGYGPVEIWGKMIKVGEEASILLDRGCLGRTLLVVFVALIVAYPAKLRVRLWGIVWMTLLLFVLNELRVIALIFVDMYDPQRFYYYHGVVIKRIFYVVLFLYWLLWVNYARKRVIQPQEL